MNNEQNNGSMFGIPVQKTTTPSSEVNQSSQETTIPGANVVPISYASADGADDSSSGSIFASQVNVVGQKSDIFVEPATGSEAVAANSNGDSQTTNSSFFVGDSNGGQTSLNMESNLNLSNQSVGNSENIMQESSPVTSSPFDIGLNDNTQSMNSIMVNNNSLSNNTGMSLDNNAGVANNTTNNTAPLTNVNDNDNNDDVVSVKKYLVHMILCCIPIAGIIILFMRAFGNKENKNVSNLAKAQLIVMAASVVLSVVFMIIGGIAMNSIANTIENNANNYTDSYSSSYDYGY